MKSGTRQTLFLIHTVSWILFIAVCVKTGVLLYSFSLSLFINPEAAKFSIRYYAAMVFLIVLISGLKAYLLSLVIRVFRKTNYLHPFSFEVSDLVSGISTVSIEIGVISLLTFGYSHWLATKSICFPALEFNLGGAAEFLLFGAIIYFIAQIFKRGIEIQSENELTV